MGCAGVYYPVMTTTASPLTLRKLGNSDLQLTAIGFGAWAIGGGNWDFAWGAQDDAESIRAIHQALDEGINWIDTAAIYGLGHSEEIVGKAVKGSSHKPLIFTKCSMRWDSDRKIYRSLKASSIAEELDGSLKRLGVETIDLYQYNRNINYFSFIYRDHNSYYTEVVFYQLPVWLGIIIIIYLVHGWAYSIIGRNYWYIYGQNFQPGKRPSAIYYKNNNNAERSKRNSLIYSFVSEIINSSIQFLFATVNQYFINIPD